MVWIVNNIYIYIVVKIYMEIFWLLLKEFAIDCYLFFCIIPGMIEYASNR